VAELKDGAVDRYRVEPEQFGMQRSDIKAIAVDSAEASLALIKRVFDNEAGPARDIVALNAGAAIYVAGLADSFAAGVEKAQELIASGAAREKLNALVELSQTLAGQAQ
jgi:anthranilate phosphoribosyltransferase